MDVQLTPTSAAAGVPGGSRLGGLSARGHGVEPRSRPDVPWPGMTCRRALRLCLLARSGALSPGQLLPELEKNEPGRTLPLHGIPYQGIPLGWLFRASLDALSRTSSMMAGCHGGRGGRALPVSCSASSISLNTLTYWLTCGLRQATGWKLSKAIFPDSIAFGSISNGASFSDGTDEGRVTSTWSTTTTEEVFSWLGFAK